MTLNEYQEQAMTTCMETCNKFPYMFINLVGEMGEFASKVAKNIRNENAIIDGDLYWTSKPTDEWVAEQRQLLSKELGDILWQLSGLCKVLNLSLEEVAKENLAKLADRQKRHVIDGNGDER